MRRSSDASGEVYADKVAVGAVTATSQAVETATSVSTSFLNRRGVDGLLGLAFSSANQIQPVQQKTFFDTVKSSLGSPLFAVSLKDRALGTYGFGFIDSSKHSTPIVWVDTDSKRGYWGFQAIGYSVGVSTSSVTKTNIDGIVDTGTSLIYVDDSIIESYYSEIPGAELNQSAGGYIFPCSATPPDFSIIIGGSTQTVPGKYINYSLASQGQGMCFGGIQSNVQVGLTIFGTFPSKIPTSFLRILVPILASVLQSKRGALLVVHIHRLLYVTDKMMRAMLRLRTRS